MRCRHEGRTGDAFLFSQLAAWGYVLAALTAVFAQRRVGEKPAARSPSQQLFSCASTSRYDCPSGGYLASPLDDGQQLHTARMVKLAQRLAILRVQLPPPTRHAKSIAAPNWTRAVDPTQTQDLGRRSPARSARQGGTARQLWAPAPRQRIHKVGAAGTPIGYNPASQIVSIARSNSAYSCTSAYNVDRPYSANGLNQYTTAGNVGFCYDARPT